jgi:REP element-mobilizing transposase RayT
MPRSLKRYIHGTVLELSSSTQEGLPFVPTKYMEVIIKGILAAAADRYPFTICHCVIMANHFHLIGVVENPADVPGFVGYFKTEVSHAVNRLLGRPRSLWVEGFYSSIILTPHDVLSRIVYLYRNPAKANLVNTISEYPGFSTYDVLLHSLTGQTERCKRICRPAIPTLPDRALTKIEDQELADKLLDSAGFEFNLTVDPWAWLNCFEESAYWNRVDVLTGLLKHLEREENQLALIRKGKPIGERALRAQNPRKQFFSKRSGKKMLCICQIVEMRLQFIADFHTAQKEARLCYQRWRRGELAHHRPPPGFFAPGGMLLANLVSLAAIL